MTDLICVHRWNAPIEASEVKVRDGRPEIVVKHFKTCQGLCKTTIEQDAPDPVVIVAKLGGPS